MKQYQLRLALFTLLLAAGFFLPVSGYAQRSTEITPKQLAALDKVMAPYRKKVNDVLAADKTGQYKSYLADLEALAKAPRERRDELEATLQRNHYEFIRKAYQKAVINHEEMRRSVAGVLGNIDFTIGEFGSIDLSSIIDQLTAPRFDGEVVCPFTTNQEESNAGAIAGCSASVHDCSAYLFSIAAIAGGCRAKGSTGGKFEIPAGTFQQITVAAQFDAGYDGFTFALGGYSQVTAKIGVRLQGPGVDKKVIVREQTALAPLVWYNRIKFEATDFSAQGIFNGSFNGNNTYTAQAYYETFAMGAANGSSDIFLFSDKYDFIRFSATGTN